MPIQRRSLLIRTAAAAAAACGLPAAQAVAGTLVQLHLVDRRTGTLLPEHRHRGASYVAGQAGERFAVRLSNRSGARILVVLSVDGVNAISGETAAVEQTGYVLAPWQVAEITGWRKSEREAAAFYFTALPDSYAARTDRPHHVGVIGAAVFRERVPLPRPVPFDISPPGPYGAAREGGAGAAAGNADRAGAEAERSAATGAAPASPAPATRQSEAAAVGRSERLGTGHGERESSPVGRTTFERASAHPAEVVQLRYDSPANLVAAGILNPWRSGPQPFPGYVPDPP